MVLGALYLFANVLTVYKQHYRANFPTHNLPIDDWRAIIDPKNCSEQDLNCLIHPNRGALWQSPLKRTDPEFRQRMRFNFMKTSWLGIKFRCDEEIACVKGLTNFVLLGVINSRFEIYVNEELQIKGDRTEQHIPIAVPVSADLTHGEIRLAIKIIHNYEAAKPAYLKAGRESIVDFATYNAIAAGYRYFHFIPVFSFIFNLVLGSLLFVFWRAYKIKSEFLVFSMLLVFASILSITRSDILFKPINEFIGSSFTHTLALFAVVSLCWMNFLFSVARLSPGYKWLGTCTFLAAWIGSFIYVFSDGLFRWNADLLYFYPRVAAIILGMVPICLQIVTLILKKESSFRLKSLFGYLALTASYLTIYCFNYMEEQPDFYPDFLKIYENFLDPIVYIIFIYFMISDFKQANYEAKVAKGKYFKVLPPKPVNGLLLRMDMKGFGHIYNELMAKDSSGDLYMDFCLRQKEIVDKNNINGFGGEQIQFVGDDFAQFFDHKEPNPDEVKNLVCCVKSLFRDIQVLVNEFGLETDFIHLRASITHGTLHPKHQFEGEKRVERYHGSIMFNSARVMDIDKKLDPDKERTLILVEEETLQHYGYLDGEFDMQTTIEDKDGNTRNIYYMDLMSRPALKGAS